MEMNIEQQRALAMAQARMAAEQSAPQAGHNAPEFRPVGVEGYNPETGMVETSKGMSAGYGAADTVTFGFGDEVAAGMIAPFSDKDYGQIVGEMRADQRGAQADNPGSYLGGQVAGGLAQAAAIGPASFAGRMGGAGLGRAALGSAIDGSLFGAAYGAGSGENGQERTLGAATGAFTGMALGAAAPVAVAGVGAALKPLAAPLMARLRPQSYADQALGEGLRRSGMSADDVSGALSRASADNQPMFNVADAMGNAGQRMLSTVARTPNDARQSVVDGLVSRQTSQGERLTDFLSTGFAAADTAAQRTARLTAERSHLANPNYANARQGAGPVNVAGAVSVADDILQPGVTRLVNPGTNIADDSLEAVVGRARRLLTDGNSVTSDFSAVMRAKQDIADMIGTAQRQGRNNQVRILSEMNSSLDAALEKASPLYRDANDAFRAQSRTIDAVEAGGAATSGRTRAADNIRAFNAMPRGEQSAFRAGYADPMIARVESSSMSPTTNKARALMTDKTGQEFPAFAAPRRGERMGRQIAREQRMFETSNAALGGSKTADNLADAAEMNKFDPGIMGNLMRGRPVAAALDAAAKFLNEAKGLPPPVMARIAEALMETNPTVARELLLASQNRATGTNARNIMLGNMLGGGVRPLAIGN